MLAKTTLASLVLCGAGMANTIDTLTSGDCTYRFIDTDGNAVVAGPCGGVAIGTVVSAITVGFTPYQFVEPSAMAEPPQPPLPPPPPHIEPPIIPPVVPPPHVVVTPEPATFGLIGIALIWIAKRGRK